MILESIAYPIGKLLGIGISAFETWQKKKDAEILEITKQNDHRRELELMEKQSILHRELEAIKTQGQIELAKENTNREEMRQLSIIATSDNEVKKSIIEHTPDWATNVMSGIRIFLGISSGVVFFYVGILSTKLLFSLINMQFPNIDQKLLSTFIESYETFYHSVVSLVLMYVGVTHTNRRLGGNIK
jgi:hypothetical protein